MVANLKQQDFLVANFDLFVERLCYSYPFDIETLRKFKDILRWDLLSFNECMDWTEELILEFKEYLDFGQGDQDAETKWINLNKAIPWSVRLLEELEDRVQWKELSGHSSIRTNDKIKYKFYHRLAPYWSEIEEEDCPSEEELGEDVEWLLHSIESSSVYPELSYHTLSEIDDPESQDWELLSQNTYLPWSIELIDRYLDHWDWEALSMNESLPWSEALIDRYRSLWHWGGLEEPNEQGDRMVRWGLTSNPGIFWTHAMMQKYRDEHDWFHLSAMYDVEWTAESILEMEMYFNYDQILFNDRFWEGLLGGMPSEILIEHLFCLFILDSSICLN